MWLQENHENTFIMDADFGPNTISQILHTEPFFKIRNNKKNKVSNKNYK